MSDDPGNAGPRRRRSRRLRRSGIGVVAGGVTLALLSVTGVLAVFTDTATHGTNTVGSREMKMPIDLKLNTSTSNDGGVCANTVDNLTTPAYNHTTLDLSFPVQSFTEWHRLCLRNEGRVGAQVTIHAVDFAQGETACSGAEAQVDTTCGRVGLRALPGELQDVLDVQFSTGLFSSGGCGNGSVADATATWAALQSTAGGHTFVMPTPSTAGTNMCVAFRLVRKDGLTEDDLQRAQTDQISWRFQFRATEIPTLPTGTLPPQT
jgi:hypothetical protein